MLPPIWGAEQLFACSALNGRNPPEADRDPLRLGLTAGENILTRKQVAPAAKNTYHPSMRFVDPKNPDRPLTEAEIRTIIARGEADIEAGRVSDLDELLAEWQAEDEADRRACLRGKPAA